MAPLLKETVVENRIAEIDSRRAAVEAEMRRTRKDSRLTELFHEFQALTRLRVAARQAQRRARAE